jgi:hypothetical protein
MDNYKHISDYHENHIAQMLFKNHIVGDLRSVEDFENAKFHIGVTLSFVDDMLRIEGTNEEKLAFLEKLSADIEKFKVREKGEQG